MGRHWNMTPQEIFDLADKDLRAVVTMWEILDDENDARKDEMRRANNG